MHPISTIRNIVSISLSFVFPAVLPLIRRVVRALAHLHRMLTPAVRAYRLYRDHLRLEVYPCCPAGSLLRPAVAFRFTFFTETGFSLAVSRFEYCPANITNDLLRFPVFLFYFGPIRAAGWAILCSRCPGEKGRSAYLTDKMK